MTPSTPHNRQGWTTVLVLAAALSLGLALNAAAQNQGTLKIKKVEPKPVKELKIRSIEPVPEVNVRSQPPRKAVIRVEDKKLEPGEEMYRMRIDDFGKLSRIDNETNEILVGDSLYPLASDVVYIIGEDQYATLPAAMLGKKVALRKHLTTGLVTEVRLYEDVRHLVEKNE